jgi:hypothetical protein
VQVLGGAAEVQPLGDRDEAPDLDQIEIADAAIVSAGDGGGAFSGGGCDLGALRCA